MTKRPTFLGYYVATDYEAPNDKPRYVVQAEYVEGFEELARFKTLAAAKIALKRFKAADARRSR